MEFFELDFTCSVFDPETNVVRFLTSFPGSPCDRSWGRGLGTRLE